MIDTHLATLFQNPSQTDVLWHDLKKYATIGRMYTENFESGVYGEITPQMQEFSRKIGAVNAESFLYIENVMLLQKIALNIFTVTTESIVAKDFATSVEQALSPIFLYRKISLSIATHSEKLVGNPRYLKHLVANLLYLIALECSEVSIISVDITESQGSTNIHITHNSPDTFLPPSTIASETLFSKEAQNPQEQHALFWFTTLFLRDYFSLSLTTNHPTLVITL